MSDDPEEMTRTEAPKSHAVQLTIFGTKLPFDIFSAIFAIFVLAGGIIGYVNSQSIPSLVAGSIFAVMLMAGSVLEATRDNHWLTFLTSAILGIMMLLRFVKSEALWPSGVFAVLSFFMIVRYSYRTYQVMSGKSSLRRP